jgi:hypothetical protein
LHIKKKEIESDPKIIEAIEKEKEKEKEEKEKEEEEAIDINH